MWNTIKDGDGRVRLLAVRAGVIGMRIPADPARGR